MTANRRPQSAPNDRELRLWKVGRVLALAFAAAVLVAGGIFYGLVVLLDFEEVDSTAKLDADTLFDLVKLSFGVVAGAGALVALVVALVVAYRRQRVDEAGAHREATRLHAERFSQAVDKLGSDSPAVRLGGVHALAGLADDAPTQDLRQTCIDVLCAYLRLPFAPDPGDMPDGTSPTDERREAHQDKKDRYRALREIQHTILRLVGDHYRIAEGLHRSWQGCNLDLTGVIIDADMDFCGARFSGGTVDFRGATFTGGEVDFGGASLSGGTVDFRGATFTGGTVYFGDARFSGGTVDFRDAWFTGGTVDFRDATFTGGTVAFDRAKFSGGTVDFRDAWFSGGTVDFDRARFSGGTVYFGDARFSGGTMYFGDATFTGGTVDFRATAGPPPQGLLAAIGAPPAATVLLPAAWLTWDSQV
ncbi:pentapeptide repeat-containing protein [Streptomyces sp. H27-C3]|uniref:pentapeptide repeat-containing protein n=1 Tax=Streptomyces sp. H27-C3 TaxID=3046305 RepID=UPI0024B96388|nr:pentapeptide repeat-containing protein [Streptomyces sp. H27-C3]MDJ0465851.1 pentapeptide repeat-containing protein [Streptomyces sp. H27-C3]